VRFARLTFVNRMQQFFDHHLKDPLGPAAVQYTGTTNA
jgi:hypothetical protein